MWPSVLHVLPPEDALQSPSALKDIWSSLSAYSVSKTSPKLLMVSASPQFHFFELESAPEPDEDDGVY